LREGASAVEEAGDRVGQQRAARHGTGDHVRARERLAELLTMWKGADPELSVLREAKALQARLKLAPADRAYR
jgi:hypothetical protein